MQDNTRQVDAVLRGSGEEEEEEEEKDEGEGGGGGWRREVAGIDW